MPDAEITATRPPLNRHRRFPYRVRPFPFRDLREAGVLAAVKPRPEQPGRVE